MVQRCFARYLLIFLLCMQAASLSASVPMPRLSDLAVLEDKTGMEDIQSITAATGFNPLSGGTFSGGYTHSVHWLRFTVVAPAGEWWLDILPPYLEDLRLYEPDPAHPGTFVERRAGFALPFAAREVDYRGFVFKLRHADDAPRTYYLRLDTDSTSIIVPRLWAPEAFFANNALEAGLLMTVLAVLLTVVLFNVNNWFLRRDSFTLWFLAYLISLAINFAGSDGFIQQYFGFDWAAANLYPIHVSGFCSLAFGYAFYRRLFLIERSQRILFRLYEGNFWLALLAIASVPLGYFVEIMPLVSALVPPMILLGTGLSVRLWQRKETGGSMLLAANLISMSSIGMVFLNLTGVISGGIVMLYSLQIASLGTIVALQLALSSRYRAEHEETLRAHEAARVAEAKAQYEHAGSVRKGRMLSMLTHELRNGLSVLRMTINCQPMDASMIEMSERAINGITEVIERSLQAERLVDGATVMESLPCDLAGMVEAITADSQDPERIRLDIATRPMLDTDLKLLRVILANLIENALKYGAKDAPVQVSVAIESAPSAAVVVTVSNAVGRAGRPDPERVFEKYYRSPQAQGYTGSGVGLHLAGQLARMLGGKLRYLAGTEAVVFQLRLQGVASFAV
jgi:signal transduction histidine kinase